MNITSLFISGAGKLRYTTLVFLMAFAAAGTDCFAQGTWTPVTNLAPDPNYGGMLLLTDGSVICKTQSGTVDGIGNIWDKLTPDIHGSYVNGTWSVIAPMHDSRLYFASQVLKDGRVFVAGGEYGTGNSTAETYDPVANTWTPAPLSPHYFADANSEILPDGRVLLGVISDTSVVGGDTTVIFNPVTNQWLPGPLSINSHDESVWVKLPDSSILFVDFMGLTSERYIPALNQWVADADVPDSLYDVYEGESGAAFLLPDGRAFFLGGPGTTAYYTPSGNTSPGTWAAGPAIPNGYGAADAPAAMMINGKILCAVSPAPSAIAYYPPPTAYYEFDYISNTFTQVGAPMGGDTDSVASYTATMLDLPDGSVLYAELVNNQYFVYTPNGQPLVAGKPVINHVTTISCDSFVVTGTLFNGISEGAAYGDDWQMATNYPLVRLTAGNKVYYARTYNWNRTGVKTGTLADTVSFSLPGNLPDTTFELVVVANGIASSPVQFISTLPGLSSALNPPAVCSNSNFTYTATSPVNGAVITWTRPAINGISNAAVTTPQASNPNEVLINTTLFPIDVIYAYNVHSGSCNNAVNVTVEVDPVPTADTIYAAGPPQLCSGNALELYGNQNGGVWNTQHSTAYYIFVYSPGTYFVVDSNQCGRAVSDSVVITALAGPVVTLTALAADTICATGQAETLTGTPAGGTYGGSVTGNIFDPSLATLGWNYVYYSYADTNGCTNTAVDSAYVEVCLGVKALSSPGPKVTIYPNPTSGLLNLSGVAVVSGVYNVTILNTSGQTLAAKEIKVANGTFETDFDMQEFATGVYFLSFGGESGVQVFKVLKF